MNLSLESIAQPLVSIIVITYNSSKYVLETLESAKSQTYNNIELIISDDCSTDNTIEICQNWIQENKERFVATKLITVPTNTGISSNCNRGVKASNGEWIKIIAGDDMLLANCIYDYISYTINCGSESTSAIHANMNVYADNFNSGNFKSLADYSKSIFNRENITANQQFILLLRYAYIGAPTIFLKRCLIISIGGFDEEMPFDDWPMFLSIVKRGVKIHYLNKVTVNYRLHNESVYNNGLTNKLLFNDFYIKDRVVYYKYRRNHLTIAERLIEDIEYKRKFLFIKLGLNRANKFNTLLNNSFLFFYYFSKRAAFFVVNKQQGSL